MLRSLMKKHCAATLGIGFMAVLAGCASTSEEPESPTARQAMRFGVKIDESRAIVSNATLNADGASFSVWSTFSRNDEEQTVAPLLLFDGETVTRSEGTWSYANTQYWFPKFTYYFVGVYPSGATGVSDYKFEDNRLSFDFTYPTDYTNTPDLLTATHTRLYLEENDNSDAVTLGFTHILSRLNFVCTVDPVVQEGMTINRLTIRNINTKGSYAIAPSDLTGAALETNDFTGGEWIASTSGEISIPLETLIAGGTTKSFFSDGANALMIIPQTVPADVEVEVAYTVGGESKTVTAKLHDTTVNAHEGVWKKGRSYSYSFALTDNEKINFTSPTIQDWNEAEGGNYIIIN